MACIRGGGDNGVTAQFRIVFLFVMPTTLVTLATSMLLIILTFYEYNSNNTMKEHVTEDGSPTVLVVQISRTQLKRTSKKRQFTIKNRSIEEKHTNAFNNSYPYPGWLVSQPME